MCERSEWVYVNLTGKVGKGTIICFQATLQFTSPFESILITICLTHWLASYLQFMRSLYINERSKCTWTTITYWFTVRKISHAIWWFYIGRVLMFYRHYNAGGQSHYFVPELACRRKTAQIRLGSGRRSIEHFLGGISTLFDTKKDAKSNHLLRGFASILHSGCSVTCPVETENQKHTGSELYY